MSMELPTVGVTMGDPAGIGPEITLKAVADDEVRRSARTVVLGDADHLESLADRVAIDVALRRIGAVDDPTTGEAVDVLDFDNVDQVEYGELSAENGRASLEYVDRAIDLATEGAVDGLANAPIHKKAIELAGSKHAGHTGLMAERTGTDRYAALVSDGELHVSHHSLHVPLSETIERISTGSVFETIELTAELVPEIGLEDPAVGVLGVNPHAGDGGVIGTLDDEEIRPAVERARDAGIDAEGPLPPDSAFNRALDGEFDCLVAMYHDQGHIPVFVDGRVPGGGVAGTVFTLGLSFVRTTTIHGTAYDVAGQGVAAPHSLIASITNAAEAIRTRDRHG
jgi:4-hydroxythreonine-4-phosphate dehydrogenase